MIWILIFAFEWLLFLEMGNFEFTIEEKHTGGFGLFFVWKG